MKYVIINGSPRKKNTWSVVEQVKKNLDGEFEEIQLAKEKIPICNGCTNCINDGEDNCPHYERIKPIVDKMKDSDGIIIASPVYALNVSALLKNLFDHTAYFYHRPYFFEKKAMVIVTTAGAGHKKVSKYIDETLRHWGVNKVYKLAFALGDKDHIESEKINKTAIKFKNDVESKKLHSPKAMDIIFYEVWRVISSKSDGIKADVEYWHETGLVNHYFSPKVKLSIFKKIFAKLMFNILKKVM